MIEIVPLGNQTAALYLTRPEKRNALNTPLLEALIRALCQFDRATKTIIILGKGHDFCTGMDLNELIDPQKNTLQLMREAIKTMQSLPQITIACVNGRAWGGGAGLALAADFLLMEETSSLAFPEVQKGLVPAIVSVLLKDKVSMQTLKELLLLSSPLTDTEAVDKSIAHMSVKKGRLLLEAENIAKQICLADVSALQQTKKLIHDLYQTEIAFLMAEKIHEHGISHEAKKRINAFLKKEH